MIAPSSFASSQFLGSWIASPRRIASRPLSARSPPSQPPRFNAAQSAPAAERPPLAFTAAPPSLYDVLGVPAGATIREIKASYRRLALACHPDAAAAAGREAASADEFMRIYSAYSTLSDPDKRADYDRGLFMLRRRRRPPPFSASSPFSSYDSPPFSGYPRRTWETDQCW